jgi:hypothetical protein
MALNVASMNEPRNMYIYNFKRMNWFEKAILETKPGRGIHFKIDLK